jgi:hypothetical protein
MDVTQISRFASSGQNKLETIYNDVTRTNIANGIVPESQHRKSGQRLLQADFGIALRDSLGIVLQNARSAYQQKVLGLGINDYIKKILPRNTKTSYTKYLGPLLLPAVLLVLDAK